MIVDDEKTTVEGLKYLIKRMFPQCKIIGVAYDGHTGYRKALTLKPDLIISDVRMPTLSGLDMIKNLQSAQCDAKFIILSGHIEFEYAKKGMELGVKYYVIKPVEEEELQTAVLGVIKEIEDDKKKNEVWEQLVQGKITHEEQKIIEEQEKKEEYRNHILRYIVVEKSDYDEYIESLLASIHFATQMKCYQCALIQLSEEGSAKQVIELGQRHMKRLNEAIKCTFFSFSPIYIGIIISSNESEQSSVLRDLLSNTKDYIEYEIKQQLLLGIGKEYDSVYGLSSSFEEARYALNFLLPKQTERIVMYEQVQGDKARIKEISPIQMEQLESSIEKMDYNKCSEVVDEIFYQYIDKNWSIQELQHFCLSILLMAIRKISPMQIILNEVVGKQVLSLDSLSRFKTMEAVKNWLINSIRSIIDIRTMYELPKNNEEIIDEMKIYMREHLAENINLSVIAERVYLNPYYLSQLFKDKTGETYIQYLTQLRMNRAKELLEKTNLKIYEISEKVGYGDSSYFSRVFEKEVGCKPKDYRIQRKEGKE